MKKHQVDCYKCCYNNATAEAWKRFESFVHILVFHDYQTEVRISLVFSFSGSLFRSLKSGRAKSGNNFSNMNPNLQINWSDRYTYVWKLYFILIFLWENSFVRSVPIEIFHQSHLRIVISLWFQVNYKRDWLLISCNSRKMSIRMWEPVAVVQLKRGKDGLRHPQKWFWSPLK